MKMPESTDCERSVRLGKVDTDARGVRGRGGKWNCVAAFA